MNLLRLVKQHYFVIARPHPLQKEGLAPVANLAEQS